MGVFFFFVGASIALRNIISSFKNKKGFVDGFLLLHIIPTINHGGMPYLTQDA